MGGNRLRGETHWNAKLSSKQVLEIRELHAKGFSHKIIARNYKITTWNVGQIVNRTTWKHI